MPLTTSHLVKTVSTILSFSVDNFVPKRSLGCGVLFLLACSGKKEQSAPVEDAKLVVVVDAAVPIDAKPPFAVTNKTSSFGSFVEVFPHDAKCPNIEWRPGPKTVAIHRCRDKSLGEQAEMLRDMISHVRSLDPSLDDNVRAVGLGDYYSYPELAARFVTYAKAHPYDEKKGQLHKWITEAANTGDMLPELAVMFQRKPKLSSVEKCSAGRATSKSETGEFVRKAGGSGTALVPLGCSMAVYEFER